MSPGSDFEEDLLQRRLHDLAATYPAHAELVHDLLDSLDYSRAMIKERGGMRNLIFTLGSKLAKQPEAGRSAWLGWVERLASDGALGARKADALKAQAEALSMTARK